MPSGGSYQGKAGSFIISAELNVHVKDHKITDVEVVRQVCGSNYYDALDENQ